MRLLFHVPLLAVLALGSCTGEDEAGASALALQAQEALAPGLPRELVPGVRLGDTVAVDARLDLILTPAADRAVLVEELSPAVCAIPEVKALVEAGGTLRFMVADREIGTVATCQET